MATTATMTGAQFDALPYQEGRRWELVGGELVEVSSPTLDHQDIAFAINQALKHYFKNKRVSGRASQDVEFALTADDRVRPDVFVLLPAKAAAVSSSRVPILGAPDIAVEIISASERASNIQQKAQRYLENGTAEVWLIYPKSRQVELRRRNQSVWLGPDAEIVTDLLPDLRIPVASIFEP
jgi:Uma2 family endonuclease